METKIIEYPLFDYEKQVWVITGGVYADCGHRPSKPGHSSCGCYGREHGGELMDAATERHLRRQIADDEGSQKQ